VTRLSPRFALPVIILMLAAALPVWLHFVSAPTRDDCADPRAFFGAGRIGGADVVPLGRRGRRYQGVEAAFRGASGGKLRLRVLRTYDPSPLLASPFRVGFAPGLYLLPGELRQLTAGEHALPVRWHATETQGAVAFEAYGYVHGGIPSSNPLGSGLRLAWEQLIHGARPVTVLIVSGSAPVAARAGLEREAEGLFVRAWRQLAAACAYP